MIIAFRKYNLRCALIPCFFLIISFNAYTQTTSKADSLKIEQIYGKAITIRDTNADMVIPYIKQGISLSQKQQYKKGLVKGFAMLASIFDRKKDVYSAKKYYEESLEIAKENGLEDLESAVLSDISANRPTHKNRNKKVIVLTLLLLLFCRFAQFKIGFLKTLNQLT